MHTPGSASAKACPSAFIQAATNQRDQLRVINTDLLAALVELERMVTLCKERRAGIDTYRETGVALEQARAAIARATRQP